MRRQTIFVRGSPPTEMPRNWSSRRPDAKPTGASTNTNRTRRSYCIPNVQLTRLFFRSYEFGGPWGVVAIMTGFPILMYYLWICLWFYDGALVHPSSVEDIKPFLARMVGHVVKVRLIYALSNPTCPLKFHSGRQPKCICVESLRGQLFLPALHCMGATRLSARRSSSAIAQLQDSYVQL